MKVEKWRGADKRGLYCPVLAWSCGPSCPHPPPAVIEPGSLALPLTVYAQDVLPTHFSSEEAGWHPSFAPLLEKGILEEFLRVRILAVTQRPWQLGSWTVEKTWGGNASLCRVFFFGEAAES